MVKHRLRKELTEFNNGIDLKTDEIAEQQKMTKAELEQKTTRILKLIQNKDQGQRMARDSNKETEVVGLVEDLYNNYQSIYEQYGHLRDEAEKIANSSKGKEKNKEDNSSSSSSSSSSFNSDSEYFSSEETNISNDLQNEQSRNLHVQIQEDELEKQIFQKNEALAKVDSLHWELDSMRKQKRESENRKNQEISENMNLIANLREQLTERIEVEKRIMEEKEKVIVLIKDLETELNTIHNMRREIDEHNIQIRSENQWLNTRNSELEITLMEHDQMNALQADGIKLGQDTEQNKQEISHRFTEIEAESNKLKRKIIDQERIITEKDEIITKLKSKTYVLDLASTKMEEIAEELRNSMEDKIRTLSHRVLVAEQLHKESRSNFRARKKRYEQEKRQLEQKIENHEAELMKLSNMNEFGMEIMARKFEEESGKLLNHILWITKELTFAKYWVKTRNNELKNMQMNLARFVAQIEEKEEHEFMLREKVWNLEAKISKEGGEKLNLIRSLGQFEKKMTKMEIILKEKDEEVFRLAEEKRDVIRQLCAVIDHHRNRYDLLKSAMLEKNVRDRIMI